MGEGGKERDAEAACVAEMEARVCGRLVWYFGIMPLFEKEEGLRGEERKEGGEEHGGVVRGIYIDDIEEGALLCEEGEGAVGVVRDKVGLRFDMEGGDVLFDAGDSAAVLFDESDVGGSATQRFEAHSAAAGKEVEEAGVGDFALADVEDGLAQHPLGGASGGAFGGFQ